MLASPAFAQTKDPEKCIACVTAKQRAQVQKKLDDLRARVKELESQLAKKPTSVGVPVVQNRIVEKRVEVPSTKRHRITALGGIMPDGVHLEGEELERKANLHETGTAVGAAYQYRFSDDWSVMAMGAVTTRSTHIPAGFVGLGYDF